MYKEYNPNPIKRRTDDCVIRAISKALGTDWEQAYDLVTAEGRSKYDMPEANHVWAGVMAKRGYKIYAIPNQCPDCYRIRDFCRDNPRGKYMLCTGTHVVTAINGDWYDTYDSGDLVPIFLLRGSNGI